MMFSQQAKIALIFLIVVTLLTACTALTVIYIDEVNNEVKTGPKSGVKTPDKPKS